MQGLREGRSREGNKDLQPWPQEGTQPEQGDLSGLPVRVKLAHTKRWLSQLGQDLGEAHVRNGARYPPNNGLRDTYLMITSDSLSTGFSTGLQKKETYNQGALHLGFDPTPEAQVESLALSHLILTKASGPETGTQKAQTTIVSARYPGNFHFFP